MEEDTAVALQPLGMSPKPALCSLAGWGGCWWALRGDGITDKSPSLSKGSSVHAAAAAERL